MSEDEWHTAMERLRSRSVDAEAETGAGEKIITETLNRIDANLAETQARLRDSPVKQSGIFSQPRRYVADSDEASEL